ILHAVLPLDGHAVPTALGHTRRREPGGDRQPSVDRRLARLPPLLQLVLSHSVSFQLSCNLAAPPRKAHRGTLAKRHGEGDSRGGVPAVSTLRRCSPALLQRPRENGRAATVPRHRLLDRNARATVMGDTEHRRRANRATGLDYVGYALRGEGMKPAPFRYHAAATLGEAVDLLVSDPDAMVIAGGQSLMPVLALRLATPSLLVDLRRVRGLDAIAIGDSGVRLGARVRWRDIEDHGPLEIAHPLLRAAIAHVAHYQIRNRGTVGGSLAHADPAAELPGVAVTCEAEITLVGAAGSRTIRAAEFFTGPLSTVRQRDEIITELYLPFWRKDRHWAFLKFAQRQGDF